MKRLFSNYLIPISVFFTLLFSVNCQRDDICDAIEVTPRLIINFIDEDPNNTDTLVKEVESLAVKLIVDKDNPDSEENRFFTEIDTIENGDGTMTISSPSVTALSLPLSTLEDELTFTFTRNFGNEDASLVETDTIVFNYTRINNFINRACGFQTIFDELSVDLRTNVWMSRFQILNTTIRDEEDRHLLLFH